MSPASNRQFKNKAGFTLIELLIVIAVIGILSGMVMVSFDGAKDKARIAKSLQFSNSVQNAIGVDMVGRWNFEKIEEGKVIDTSGYGNDGVVNGATLVPDLEQLGNALSFDGVDDYVEISEDGLGESIPALSISVWAKASKKTDYGYIVHRSASNAIGASVYWIGINSSGNYAAAIDGRYSYGDTKVAADGSKWNFLVITYDGNTQKVYVDGTLKVSYSFGVITNSMVANRIGFGSTPLSPSYRPIQGLIDDVHIYSSALSSSAIRENYLAGLDKLLAGGQITEDDYQQRIAELNSNHVARK